MEKNSDDNRDRNPCLCRYTISAAGSDSFFVGLVSCIPHSSGSKMDGEEVAHPKGNCGRHSDGNPDGCDCISFVEVIWPPAGAGEKIV